MWLSAQSAWAQADRFSRNFAEATEQFPLSPPIAELLVGSAWMMNVRWMLRQGGCAVETAAVQNLRYR